MEHVFLIADNSQPSCSNSRNHLVIPSDSEDNQEPEVVVEMAKPGGSKKIQRESEQGSCS